MTEYWVAIVGPVEREELPRPALVDLMREAVSAAFTELVGREPELVFSAWGCGEEVKNRISELISRELWQSLEAREISEMAPKAPSTHP